MRRRQVVVPLLSRSSLINYCATISEIAGRFAAGLKLGDHFVYNGTCMKLSLPLRIFFIFRCGICSAQSGARRVRDCPARNAADLHVFQTIATALYRPRTIGTRLPGARGT
jgi:hypothetical protein